LEHVRTYHRQNNFTQKIRLHGASASPYKTNHTDTNYPAPQRGHTAEAAARVDPAFARGGSRFRGRASMSMRQRPAPTRDRLLRILQTAPAGVGLTTAEVATRMDQSTKYIASQLGRMRTYGYVHKISPPTPSPHELNRWTLRERR
jgi:O6-methylguanine-DNA--protein-cysteine methyltransferase